MFEVNELRDELTKKLQTPEFENYVEISAGSKKVVIVKKYIDDYLHGIRNFEVFEDDVWVISYPKCGTTWTQEMVWLLNNDLDYDAALSTKLIFRFPYIEFGGLSSFVAVNTIERCKNLARPRHIKSHLPLFLLPDQLWTVKPKIFYVTRNPKDAAVSYFHHSRNIGGYLGSKEDFFEAFLNDKLVYSPFSSHVLDFYEASKKFSNILYLFYEDMQKDLEREIKKVMTFMGKNYSQPQIMELTQHLSFASMKKNPSCNWEPNVLPQEIKDQATEKFEFIREGKTGSHKNEMSDEIIRKFDEYSERFSKHPEVATAFGV